MLRRYIDDLTNEELKEVFYVNRNLQTMVLNNFYGVQLGSSSVEFEIATDHFVEFYAHEHLSEAFIEGENFTLYEQRTYNFDDGDYVTGFEDFNEVAIDKVKEADIDM